MTVVALGHRFRPDLRAVIESAGFTVLEAGARMGILRAVAEGLAEAVAVVGEASDPELADFVRTLGLIADVRTVVLVDEPTAEVTVRLLEVGAVEVMAGDVSADEFVARLRTRLRERRDGAETSADAVSVRSGELHIDRAAMEVRRDGERVQLTRTEFAVLDVLAARRGEVVTAQAIADAVWRDAGATRVQSVRVYIGRLRDKLERVPAHPRYVINRWGMGYQLLIHPVRRTAGRQPQAWGAPGSDDGRRTSVSRRAGSGAQMDDLLSVPGAGGHAPRTVRGPG